MYINESGELCGVSTEDAIALQNDLRRWGNATKIGESAFANCSVKGALIIPTQIVEIGDCAFAGSSFSGFFLSSELEKIGEHAFVYCNELKEIIVPMSVDSIGDRAFFGCGNLTRVTVQGPKTRIGLGVFDKCPNLYYITRGRKEFKNQYNSKALALAQSEME